MLDNKLRQSKLGCLDGTSTCATSTEHLDSNGMSIRQLLHCAIFLYQWHSDTSSEHSVILLPPLSQGGRIVTRDIMFTLVYLVCDIFVLSVTYFLPVSCCPFPMLWHFVPLWHFGLMFLCSFLRLCDILSMCNNLFLVWRGCPCVCVCVSLLTQVFVSHVP